jgi:hypothetical protein
MTTPTDDDGPAPGDWLSLADAAHDELLRQVIEKKLASLSPEELRMWLARKLDLPLEEVIVERPPEGDGE